MAVQFKGMNEICKYLRRSESTVLGWIRDMDFPAKKTKKGGIYVAAKAKVDDWLEQTGALRVEKKRRMRTVQNRKRW